MMRAWVEKTVEYLSWAMALLLCLSLSIFLSYLLIKGLPSLGSELVFGDSDPLSVLLGRERVFDGIFPAVVGTLSLVTLSTLIALPLGICSGIYLSEYATPAMKKAVGGLFDVLAGIPSIVVGLYGFSVAIFLHHHFSDRLGPCLLISALSLGILVLPYIVRSTQTSLEQLPAHIRCTATALGATRLQNVAYVLIPNALSGISSGVILAIGRCAEDTAVILLTGVVATAGVPSSLLAQYEALPFYIFYISSQYTNPAELSNGYGACLVLLGICSALFMVAHGMKKRLFNWTLYGR
jgi:phosphate transport system permease protein